MRPRIVWIDSARAIGIVLVVLGHTAAPPDWLAALIFSFHMPLFFALSGYVQRPLDGLHAIGGYLRRQLRGIVLPYAVFWWLSYAYSIGARLISPATRAETRVAWSHLIDFARGTSRVVPGNDALWFLPCLFATLLLLVPVLLARRSLLSMLYALICGGLGFWLSLGAGLRLPWSFDLALIALPFATIGQLAARHGAALIDRFRRRAWLLIGGLAALLAAIVLLNGRVDMNLALWGNPLLFYAGAIVGIALTVALALRLPANRALGWLGRNTITMFALHFVLFSLFTTIAVLTLGVDRGVERVPWVGLLYAIGAILACVPIAAIFRRVAPWAIGARRTPDVHATTRRESAS